MTIGLILWLMGLWVCTSDILASEYPNTKVLCDHGERLWQQQISSSIPEALQRILARHKGHGISAHFTEEKHVTLLQRPLRSSGTIVFLPDKGLYRKLNAPFEQELLITSEAIHQRDHDGRTDKLALEQLPIAKTLVDAFLSVFSGSWKDLQRHFQVYFSMENHRWQLTLKPKYEAMRMLIACIVLEGTHENLASFAVWETNGDLTFDQLSASHILPPEQWIDYQSYFTWALKMSQ